jgi:hypothetical protein
MDLDRFGFFEFAPEAGIDCDRVAARGGCRGGGHGGRRRPPGSVRPAAEKGVRVAALGQAVRVHARSINNADVGRECV